MDEQHLIYRIVDAVTEEHLSAATALKVLDELTYRDDYPYSVRPLALARALRDRYPDGAPGVIRDAIAELLDVALDEVEDGSDVFHASEPEEEDEPEEGNAEAPTDAELAAFKEAAGRLLQAFIWGETKEGYAYWYETYKRLCDLAGGAEKIVPIGKRNDAEDTLELGSLLGRGFYWHRFGGYDYWQPRHASIYALGRRLQGEAEEVEPEEATENFSEEDRETASKIRGMLSTAFLWLSDKRGHDYWHDLSTALGRVSGEGDTVPKYHRWPDDTDQAERRQAVRKAMYAGFYWDDTKEGFDWWQERARALTE